MSSNLEEAILCLERQYWQLPDPRALGRRLVALEQGLMASWMHVGGDAAPAPTPNSTFSGTVSRCNLTASGAGWTVTIRNPSNQVLWTGTTTNAGGFGLFSGSLFLASNTTLTITVTAPNSRWADAVYTQAFTAGGNTNIPNRPLTPAAGYACGNTCVDPIATTLHLTAGTPCSGDTFPSDTLVYRTRPPALAALVGAGSSWIGSATVVGGGQNWTYWLQGPTVLGIFRAGAQGSVASTVTFTCYPVVTATFTCPPFNFSGTISE